MAVPPLGVGGLAGVTQVISDPTQPTACVIRVGVP
jgi:hypothetical protein